MKKIFVLLGVLMICSNMVWGNDQFDNYGTSGDSADEISSEAQSGAAISLKEIILDTIKEEQESTFYNRLLKDDNTVTQEEAARILCRYIQAAPIYLPEKDNCTSPYIGRLIIEGIWGAFSYDENRVITASDWYALYDGAKQFKENKDYVKNALALSSSDMRQKINSYRASLSKPFAFKKISLGTLNKSNKKLSLEDKFCDLYELRNISYVPISALESLGFKMQKDSSSTRFIYEASDGEPLKTSNLSKKEVFMSNESVYIGELKTYVLQAGMELLIPVRALQVYFSLNVMADQVELLPNGERINQYLLSDEVFFVNLTETPIKVTFKDYYWDGQNIIESKNENEVIVPKGKLPKNSKLYTLRNGYYLTTVIEAVEMEDRRIEIRQDLGQNCLDLLNIYQQRAVKPEPQTEKEPEKESVKEMGFPPSIIIGTMRYSVGGFSKGQEVEVWAAEDGKVYFVKDNKGNTIKIPWNSIKIPPNPPTAKDKPSKDQIEAFINSKNMNSKTQYLVWTDLYRQQTYIFKGQKNEWQLIKTLLCSSGKNSTPTPRGIFALKGRVPYFGVDKGYRCKYAFQIFGDYLYHSIIFDVTGTRLLEGKGVLGHRASHGCVRFSVEDSLWFYNTLKTGTTVWIN